MAQLAAGLFHATGQAGALEPMLTTVKYRIAASGLAVRHELVETDWSRVLVIIGEK